MKIGKMEGSPEEIRDLFQNNGLNLSDYLERPEPPLRPVWFVVPILLFLVSLSWLTLFTPTSAPVLTFAFSIGCCAGIWIAVNVQIRFKSPWAAVFVIVGTVLIMLVAIGVVTPLEMIQHLEELNR